MDTGRWFVVFASWGYHGNLCLFVTFSKYMHTRVHAYPHILIHTMMRILVSEDSFFILL